MIKIAPSILAADFTRLYEEVKKVEMAGVDMIHIDVMDGHFVPNITMGQPVIKSLRKATALPLDVHLMITNPDQTIDSFIDAGADILTVHIETCPHIHRTVQKIKERRIKVAVALNPGTPLNLLDCILGELDMVLLMSVNPGFGGQTYIDFVTEKIKKLHEMITKLGIAIDIQVDGGIGPSNIHEVAQAGANVIVAGSAIFGASDVSKTIKSMKNLQRSIQ